MLTSSTFPSGSKTITLIKIINDRDLEVTLCSLGASIYEVRYGGEVLTITPTKIEDFLTTSGYFGKTVGRVCGRLKDGRFSVNGITYQTDCNEGHNSLHSGHEGFAFQNFDYEWLENEREYQVCFRYRSPDKEAGFPGNMRFEVTYVIEKADNAFHILFDSMCDQDGPTNFTNHAYFNLNLREEDLLEQELRIPASHYLTMDEEMIVMGSDEVSEVLDFRHYASLKGRIEDASLQNHRTYGYDHDFCLDQDRLHPALCLYSPTKNITLIVDSDYPIVHIYSGNYPTKYDLTAGVKDRRYLGLAIECKKNPLEDLNVKAFAHDRHQITYRLVKGRAK